MIPDQIVELVHGAAFLSLGTRNEKLHPAHTFAIGAIVNADRETVTCFVPQSRTERILRNLENNGKITLGANSATHEAYQLKGRYVSVRPADEKDRAIQEIYRKKLVSFTVQHGYPEEVIRPLVLGFVYQPAVAITFRVEEIFLQTPGPDAGKRLR